MTISSIPSLLGIFALAFLLLLLAKVIKQPADDKPAKQLLILLLIEDKGTEDRGTVTLFAISTCLLRYRQ